MCMYITILVGGFNPSENMSLSIGMMKFPRLMEKYKSCSSHHQSEYHLSQSTLRKTENSGHPWLVSISGPKGPCLGLHYVSC